MTIFTNRITSKDIRVELIPYGDTPRNHLFTVGVKGASAAGTFKLSVNGMVTSAITVTAGAFASTALSTALGGLKNPDGTAMVADTDFTITGTTTPLAVEFKGKNAKRTFFIKIVEENITGGSVYITDEIMGGDVVVLSAEASSFDYSVTTDNVDVTSIADFETSMIAVKSSMSFNVSLFNALQDYLYVLKAEHLWGVMTVYPVGLGEGKEYFSFVFLKSEFSETFPDHEKVEITLAGDRIGAMVVPFGTKQA